MRRMATLLRLALRDLLAERVMALCLVIGVAAVMVPLLLLGSLKVGFIDRLREELIADPAFRELRPGDAGLKDEAFLAALRALPEVEFATLSTMMVPREVIFRAAGRSPRFEARLLPSAAGDPLLQRSGVAGALAPGEAVISARLVAEAGLQIGDRLEILITRTMASGRERAETGLILRGFLPDEQTSGPVILADAGLDSAVESWRAGLAVPDLGWPGAETAMAENHAAILLATETALSPYELRDLELRMGAGEPQPLPQQEYRALVGLGELELPASARLGEMHIYRITRQGGAGFSPSDLAAVPQILGSRRVAVSGLAPPLDLPGGGQVALVDFSLLGFACGNHCVKSGQRLLSFDDLALHSEAVPVGLTLQLPGGPRLPTYVSQIELPGDLMLADWRLGGLLRAAEVSRLSFDRAANRFTEAEIGRRGFRVIARDLDAVVPVAEAVRALGHSVHSREEDVLRLQRLEQVLDMLVLLVAAVVLGGGFAVLGINSFANVQRKIGDFAVLRLLGMERRATFLLPLIQCVIVAALGSVLSVLLWHGIAGWLNGPVAEGLGVSGQLARLYPSQLVMTSALMVTGTLIACLASAFHATRADPAVALKAVV